MFLPMFLHPHSKWPLLKQHFILVVSPHSSVGLYPKEAVKMLSLAAMTRVCSGGKMG